MDSADRAIARSKSILDIPFDDVVVPCMTQYWNDYNLLDMLWASERFPAFNDWVKRIIGAKRRLHVASTICGKEIYGVATKKCRQLRSIHIYYMPKGRKSESLSVLMANNPLISEIRISCDYLDLPKVFSLTTAWKNLTHLLLVGLNSNTPKDKFLKDFTKSKILLQEVAVKSVCGITGKALAAFFAKQPALRSVNLTRLRVSVRPTLLTIGRTCRELEKISVSDCMLIEDDGIWEIAEKCPKVRTILIPPHLRADRALYRAKVSLETLQFLSSKNIAFRNSDELWMMETLRRNGHDLDVYNLDPGSAPKPDRFDDSDDEDGYYYNH